MSDIRLYMLQTGSMKCKVHNIKMNQGDGAPFEIPIPFYLLTHPKGHMIIDGGTAIEAAADAHGYWGTVANVYQPVMEQDEGCVAQLRKLGIEPEEIRYVMQSHLHIDHTGSVGRFPNATHVVQRAEYEYAFTPDWYASGAYCRKDFDRPGLKWQFLNGLADDELDFFGDGTLKVIFSPGHSPGHQSFLVTLPNTGPMLLAVDAAYTFDHWNEQALPGFASSMVDAVRSVQKLQGLVQRTGAQVITGHDPDAWPKLRRAPQWYD
ncbi:MAG TPA: N-acyl homoserine lactonase family protein [Paraburkholderia sp.]|jgi:glyoxylase-like metal-dependent hydrolase (beta-lactamase superfamily II)